MSKARPLSCFLCIAASWWLRSGSSVKNIITLTLTSSTEEDSLLSRPVVVCGSWTNSLTNNYLSDWDKLKKHTTKKREVCHVLQWNSVHKPRSTIVRLTVKPTDTISRTQPRRKPLLLHSLYATSCSMTWINSMLMIIVKDTLNICSKGYPMNGSWLAAAP